MATQISPYDYDLPETRDINAGDSRTFAFTVVDADGNPVDISNATVTWALFNRPYQDDPADAVLSGDDADVEVVTDNRVDTTAGEFEIRLEPSATEELWGEFTQRPEVVQLGGSTASWRGTVVVSA